MAIITFGSVSSSSVVPSAGDTISVTSGVLRAACRSGTVCSNNPVLLAVMTSLEFDAYSGSYGGIHSLEDSHSGDTTLRKEFAHRSLTAVSVVIKPPLVALVPVCVLSIPTQSGSCSDLTVDLSASTGSGGRPWKNVTWVIVSTKGDTSAISSYVTANFDTAVNVITIPKALLPAAQYLFTATIINFFGHSASMSSQVDVSGKFPQFLIFMLA